MKLRFHPLFKTDLDEAVHYHNRQRDGLGDELRQEVEETVEKILERPERFSRTYGEVRRARLKRFKAYAVRYRLQGDNIHYLSVLHGARHPDTGKDRS